MNRLPPRPETTTPIHPLAEAYAHESVTQRERETPYRSRSDAARQRKYLMWEVETTGGICSKLQSARKRENAKERRRLDGLEETERRDAEGVVGKERSRWVSRENRTILIN
ncbi:hypothetical protein B296_00049506 [Ensete ventricosum]|uniref:Uncharacterized protein n=1 Tax=Ensete ventricosum TaxID=4639 RepID=A0A426XFB8_ENSVE|nr:hypothetical protein B296_00049506 [Ensete ventricosum]